MEEDKIQSLHDSLSKLRKSAGLGISSHLNFGGPNKSSHTKRNDGLPSNELYSNFVREGLYDHTKKDQNDAAKYGDGRFIKRNFDDCTSVEGQADDVSSDLLQGLSLCKLPKYGGNANHILDHAHILVSVCLDLSLYLSLEI